MSKFFLFISFSVALMISVVAKAENFYSFKYTDTNKKVVSFNEFKGKTVMVVNIATRCGFTGQLEDLEKLYQSYKNKNFVIVGFPSNDFMSQAPESSDEIANFCRLKYGATFPIFEKQTIIGDKKNDLYKWLTSQKESEGEIGWNFVKFLIDKNGKVISRYSSRVNPLDADIKKDIEKIL